MGDNGHDRLGQNDNIEANCVPSQTGKTQLRILSLNVCGLVSKLKCPDFLSLINGYDLIGLQETKTDDVDSYIEIPGFEIFFHNRDCISRYRSGGMALIVRKSLVPFIKLDKHSQSKLILFFTISNSVYGTGNSNEDLRCGIVYIPPHGSKYASTDPYLEIQEELFRFCGDSKHILLFGDFNSRSKDLSDFTNFDDFISEFYGTQDLLEENAKSLDCFECCNIPLNRKSADKVVNSYGYNLLEFCKSNNLFILNGRIGTDYEAPKLTCKNKSTVDYFLSSPYVFEYIENFCVHEFSSLFSDAHSPVSLIFRSNFEKPQPTEIKYNLRSGKLWNSEKADVFVENFDIVHVLQVESKLNNILDQKDVKNADIDDIVGDIASLFQSCTKESFGLRKNITSNSKSSNSKPWFNSACIRSRNLYNKTRKMYNRYKSEYYKNLLKIVSSSYKKTLSKQNKRFRDEKVSRLRHLKKNDPREYWKIINSSKKSENNYASLNDFYDFFKNVNSQDNFDSAQNNVETNNNDFGVSTDDDTKEINQPIMESEILLAAKSLKNNKSPGLDCILNEHIKSTIHIMLPVYVKLFNLIFDTGIIPESWTTGVIKPIFKNKGSPESPENYRPITLLSGLENCLQRLLIPD